MRMKLIINHLHPKRLCAANSRINDWLSHNQS